MTSANLETFTHKPLTPGRVIRVLTLQPSRHVESDITCDLNELRLDEYTSTFEALSYVWGVRKDGFQVVCQGKLLSVTETCLQALRYLRHKRKPRQLWVDAICIDQTSKTERGHQVGLMGEIYDVASDVVVWLGESSPEFEQAFREINTLSSKARRGIKAVCKKANGKFEIPSLYYAITNHDWIHRVWTFQEFILGRAITLQLGHFSLPWQAIAKGINPTTSRRRDAVQESALVSLATTRDTWKKIGRDASHASISPVERANYLLYTLAWTFECMSIRVCSEPLDRIFALYGLLRNAGLALPMPDYEASTDDVERAVTWSCITATNSLLILYYLDLYRHRTGGSTWSINWMHSRTVHPSRGVFEEYRRTRISTFRPGSETRMENDRLMVEGINYGQVELIGSVVPDSNPDESDSSYMYRLQRWFRVLASLAANLQDCPDGMDARYALVAAFYEGFQGKIHAQRDFMLEVHLKLLGFTRKQSPDDIVADIVNNIDATTLESHLVNVARQCAGGSAFRTSQGWVGITQEPLRTTDQLALLHGSAVPVVLRPRDDSYALIGFASVKGILEESWPLTGEEVGTQEIVLM